MSHHNVNARELIQAILEAANSGLDWTIPVILDYASEHPENFIESVKKLTNVVIREKSVKLVMRNYGRNKIIAVKMVRELTGLGLKEAKDAVESGNFNVYCSNDEIFPSVGEIMPYKQAVNLLNVMHDLWPKVFTDAIIPVCEIVSE